MFNYSNRIEAFRKDKVILSTGFRDKLLGHRKANRDRLISRLPSQITGVSISTGNFRPQGSFAMQTVIQTKFKDEEYDIDDGLVLNRHELVDSRGEELSAKAVKEKVRESLKDERFNRQPRHCANCVRVFYADSDEEKHHVDFPSYRLWVDDDGAEHRELSSETGWIESDPTAVNSWMSNLISDRNSEVSGRGTQFRQLVQLLKRFCRSRKKSDWDLPNGMKLTMLVAECQGDYNSRIDVAFRNLLRRLHNRLLDDKVIRNLAHPEQPAITRGDDDQNVIDLEEKLEEALEKLEVLDRPAGEEVDNVRRAWDWVFRTNGFFAEYDSEAATKTALVSVAESKSLFAVPWRERPHWPLQPSAWVTLEGKYANSTQTLQWTRFENDGDLLPKHIKLRFFARTNAPPPYTVYWQIVNTGNQALSAGASRGNIVESSTVGAGGLRSTTASNVTRDESTLYSGSHWVECFIVTKDVCVARSGPFVVNIR